MTTFAMVAVCLLAGAQTRDIHIVSVNDMHVPLDNMPKLAAIVDSLRTIDSQTLVFSAGDNRTGDPINDLYPITSYPMTALMNLIGFDASALGNHEFDSNEEGLAKVIAASNFPYLCANIKADPALNIQTVPYRIFEIGGITIGVLGVVQIDAKGKPSAHPDLMRDLSFTSYDEAIQQYKWLRDKVDVFILLSHIGYEDDLVVAEKYPFFDVILGGHSHTQLEGGEMHNGVLVTQNTNKLKRLTYTTINVKDRKVVGKAAKNIEVESYGKKNELASVMLDYFASNPEFHRLLTTAKRDFPTSQQLGCMMCDAMQEFTHADLVLQNGGGVRLDDYPAGPITVGDVLRIDPFGNDCIEMTVTGKEFKDMLLACHNNDNHDTPYLAGATCVFIPSPDPNVKAKDVKIFTPDGKKFNMKKKYKLVCSSYVAAVCNTPRADEGENLGIKCSDMIIKFLDGHEPIDYHDAVRVTIAN